MAGLVQLLLLVYLEKFLLALICSLNVGLMLISSPVFVFVFGLFVFV